MSSAAIIPGQAALVDIANTNQAAGVGLRDTALRRQGSSHGMNGLGLDLIKHAHFTRRAAGIAILAEIFLSLLVNVLVRTLFGDLSYATANREVPVRVVRIDKVNPNSRIAPHIAILDVAFDGIDHNVLAIIVDPNGRHLGASVRH